MTNLSYIKRYQCHTGTSHGQLCIYLDYMHWNDSRIKRYFFVIYDGRKIIFHLPVISSKLLSLAHLNKQWFPMKRSVVSSENTCISRNKTNFVLGGHCECKIFYVQWETHRGSTYIVRWSRPLNGTVVEEHNFVWWLVTFHRFCYLGRRYSSFTSNFPKSPTSGSFK
jgi:hypothetical protein